MAYSTPEQLSAYNSSFQAKQAAKQAAGKSGLLPQIGWDMDDWYASFVPAPSAGSSTSTAGTLTGQRTTEGSEATGYKPLIPDPLKIYSDAIAGATGALPVITGLTTDINKYNQGQLLDQITSLYPQFTETVGTLGGNISDWAKGNISQSTTNQLSQRLAERGISSGLGTYSPSSNAALMAVLGKTSEGLQQQGLAGFGNLVNAIPKVAPTDPTKWMVTPEKMYDAQLYANLIASAPNSAAAYNLAMANANRGLSAGYGAGASGGGGGGGNSNASFAEDLIKKYGLGTGKTTTSSGTENTSGSDFELNPEYFDPSGMPWFSGENTNEAMNLPNYDVPINFPGADSNGFLPQLPELNTNFDPFNNWDYNDLGLQYQ